MIKILDNFLPTQMALDLRTQIISTPHENEYGGGYFANDYATRESIDKIVDHVDNIPELKMLQFIRAWSFIYDNQCIGLGIHADEAGYNINLWLTPDNSVLDKNKNGIFIWTMKPPTGMKWDEYNRAKAGEKITRNVIPVKIPYKFNRAILFDSLYFHKTDNVSMFSGIENKRVNITFLYERKKNG